MLIRVDSCRTRVDSCLARVDLCWFVLNRVRLVLIRVRLVLIRVDLCRFVLIRVYSWWYSCIRIDLIGFYCSRPNKIQWSIVKYTFRARTSDVRIRFIPFIKNSVQQKNMLNVGCGRNFWIKSILIHEYQHKSTRVNTSQHESTRVWHESKRVRHESMRINTSQHESNTSRHESNTNQHESKTNLDHKK